MIRRPFIAIVAAAISTVCLAQEGKPIRLGVLNDQSGVYADFGGRGFVISAQMAGEDYVGGRLRKPLAGLWSATPKKPEQSPHHGRA